MSDAPPRIESERLVLRMPTLADADGVAEQLTDPEVMRWIGGGRTLTREEAPAAVQGWLDRWAANGFGHFAVERKEDGRFLGRVGLIVWDTRDWRHVTLAEAGVHAQIELGWAFAREHWGRGYATEAALAARDWARRECGVGRLISLIHEDNVRSQAVARRLGARPVGTVTILGSVPVVVWEHPS